jgi:hypothetical protein
VTPWPCGTWASPRAQPSGFPARIAAQREVHVILATDRMQIDRLAPGRRQWSLRGPPGHRVPALDAHAPHWMCRNCVKARTVHGAYGAEMRELRRLMRALDEEQGACWSW